MDNKEITKLNNDINRIKKKLIDRAKKKGIYENFGQNEVRALEDKYINISVFNTEMNFKRIIINEFDDWCQTYTN